MSAAVPFFGRLSTVPELEDALCMACGRRVEYVDDLLCSHCHRDRVAQERCLKCETALDLQERANLMCSACEANR